MGTRLYAEFENIGADVISGDYYRTKIDGNDETIDFEITPGNKLTIDMSLTGFCYYIFTIRQEGENPNTNYLEIRSVADFLLFQKFLEQNYTMQLDNARPDYRTLL